MFARRPFQGASPEMATYLFVGLDANYDAEIDQGPIFSKIREYHDNGVSFWHKYGVHHPFLLPEYSGDGRFYHRSFSRIGFSPKHAHLVSFIELLHLPTSGRSSLVPSDLSAPHLEYLNRVVLDGSAQHIFIPNGVARLMRATKAFKWLPKAPQDNVGPLGVLFQDGRKTVYSHLHFSVYGKFEQRKVAEAATISKLLPMNF